MIFEKPLRCKIKTGSPYYADEKGMCYGYVDISRQGNTLYRYAIVALDSGTEPGTWGINDVLLQHNEWVDMQQVLQSL